MPDAGLFSILPAALSAGSALGGLFGGGGNTNASNVALPPTFNMPGMGQAAGGALSGIGGLQGMNLPAQLIPAYQDLQSRVGFGNPFAGNAVSSAMNTGGAATNLGQNMLGAGNTLMGAGAGLLPYSTNLLNSGFDPQSALYNRTVQQLQDQTRAGLEARGLSMSPYGAGVEGQTMGNFNIDWQNNQLQRQLAAAQGAGGLVGAGGGAMTTGANLGTGGISQMNFGGNLPYQTFGGIAGDQLSGLNALSGAGMAATQIPQTSIQDYLSYIGAGNQASGVANDMARTALARANLGFNQNQTLGNQFGAGLAGIGRGLGFGGGNTGWGGGGGGYPAMNWNPVGWAMNTGGGGGAITGL